MTERSEMEAVIEAVLFVASEPVPRHRLIELFDAGEREAAAAALESVLGRYGGGSSGALPVPEPGREPEEPRAETAQLALDSPAEPPDDPADEPADDPAGHPADAPEPRAEDGAPAVEPASAGERIAQAERAAESRGVMVEEVAGGVRLVTRPELVGWLRRFFEIAGGNKLSMAALETLAIIAYRQPMTGPEIQELRSVSPVGVLKTLLERRLVRIAGRKEVVGKPFLYATTREFLIHFGLKSLKDLPPLEEFEEAFGGMAQGGGLGSGELPADGDREEQILAEAAALEEIAERAEEVLESEAGGDGRPQEVEAT